MSKEKIEVFDVVRLNSGGPDLFVFKIENGVLSCAWSDANGKINLGKFVSATVKYQYTSSLADEVIYSHEN